MQELTARERYAERLAQLDTNELLNAHETNVRQATNLPITHDHWESTHEMVRMTRGELLKRMGA